METRLFDARQKATTPPSRLCVFVSHRQADVAKATRIAYLACQLGFDYWLDVLDPTLSGVPAALTPTPEQSAFAIAAIIEMALLNSTHVVAVMTPNTKGSQWVPYEFGRVKAPVPISLQAASWVDQALAHFDLPEYLHLGPKLYSEPDITHWLRTEYQKSTGRMPTTTCGWTQIVPPAL